MGRYPEAGDVFRDAEAQIEQARAVCTHLRPVHDTPAEAYLVDHRRIPRDTVRACIDLYYLPPPLTELGRPPQDHALVSVLRDAARDWSGIQLEFCTIDGTVTGTAPGKVTLALREHGVRDGLFRAGSGSGDIAYLTEGYSTDALSIAALSIGSACGCGARTVLGYALPSEPEVVVCPDREPDSTVVDLRTGKSAADRHRADYKRAIDLAKIAGKTVRLARAPDCADGCKDANDILRNHGPEALRELLQDAEEQGLSLDGEARRLALVDDSLERDQGVKARAFALKLRTALLRERVEHYRSQGKTAPDAAEGPGSTLDLSDPAPWPDPVDGDALIGELLGKLCEFVVLGESDAVATALWVVHAHGHDTAFHSPRLAVTSPTLRCGKSTLLRSLRRLCPRPLSSSNTSAAVVFRVIEAFKPTLLIDEIDQMDPDKQREIVGIVNSSHCRLDAQILRTVGEDHEPRAFSTWAPMALAAIGKLPPQWVDRSIAIRMRRRKRDERTERMRLDRDQGFARLAQMSARWAADNAHALREADPPMPAALHDRAADNWRHLLAIADRAGGDWPRRVREAAVALSTDTEDADTLGIALLLDIRAVFDQTGAAELWSEEVLAALKGLPERPWAELSRGKGLSTKRTADLLKGFGIRSKQIKRGSTNKNGYSRDAFTDAWNRYCAGTEPVQSSDPLPAAESASFSDFQSSTANEPVEDRIGKNLRHTAAGRGSEDCEPPPAAQTRICPTCGAAFEHAGKGRAPVRCPDCRGAGKRPSIKRKRSGRHAPLKDATTAEAEAEQVIAGMAAGARCARCGAAFRADETPVLIAGRHYHDDDACAGEIRRHLVQEAH